MNSRTKIVVLRLKELIHLGVFVALCLILILLLWVAFRPKETNSPIPSGTDTNTENGEEMNSLSNTAGIYIPGVYSTALVLGN